MDRSGTSLWGVSNLNTGANRRKRSNRNKRSRSIDTIALFAEIDEFLGCEQWASNNSTRLDDSAAHVFGIVSRWLGCRCRSSAGIIHSAIIGTLEVVIKGSVKGLLQNRLPEAFSPLQVGCHLSFHFGDHRKPLFHFGHNKFLLG